MSAQESREFLERYFGAMMDNPKTAALIDQFVADPELKEHILLFEAAFPNYQIRIEDTVAEDDKIAVRATFAGVHRGEFMGVAPSGNEVTLPLMLIYRIENAKVARFWMSADVMSLMQQLQTPAQASAAPA